MSIKPVIAPKPDAQTTAPRWVKWDLSDPRPADIIHADVTKQAIVDHLKLEVITLTELLMEHMDGTRYIIFSGEVNTLIEEIDKVSKGLSIRLT